MSPAIIQLQTLRHTNVADKTIWKSDKYGDTIIRGTLANIEACGWFVTQLNSDTTTVSSICTVQVDKITLRADNVKVKCALLGTDDYACGWCKS